jgi:hypothetical protein
VTNRNFLDVQRSLSGRRWTARLRDDRLAQAIAERHELPEILGRVMAARGVGLDEAEAFLNPTIRSLMPQPSALKDMERERSVWRKPSSRRPASASSAIMMSMAFLLRQSSCCSSAPWARTQSSMCRTG